MAKFIAFLFIASLIIAVIVISTSTNSDYTLTQVSNGGAQSAFNLVKSALGQ